MRMTEELKEAMRASRLRAEADENSSVSAGRRNSGENLRREYRELLASLKRPGGVHPGECGRINARLDELRDGFDCYTPSERAAHPELFRETL